MGDDAIASQLAVVDTGVAADSTDPSREAPNIAFSRDWHALSGALRKAPDKWLDRGFASDLAPTRGWNSLAELAQRGGPAEVDPVAPPLDLGKQLRLAQHLLCEVDKLVDLERRKLKVGSLDETLALAVSV
jgi:hypothetical protein